ncbi:hypothetical protein A3J78_01015 [Candidatus Beckwithbacteria bacterium RBG_13_35_6]|uniref:CarD-like/TRCF RNAP-interacting domain-containing protein n=1 Tax=Candidatus Beckwithbacteria bacterium RBG_13_35_6 TaxID=1797456 RepID=A0A1F5DD90_9BACT|nr:MAG: hypothetical protein A3J78_01015 [Candidatus Beckwithbacteria bacterium RBG_13_35_6]
MNNSKALRVGDKIVKCNKVYIIFKIKKDKIVDKKETTILFKPYFATEFNKTLILSIPLDCIDKTNIRLPISKKELINLFGELSKHVEAEIAIDISSAKELLSLNEPYKSAEVLRRLWLEKSDESASFTQSKEEVFKLAVSQLIEEVAFVGGYTLKKAKRKMQKALKKKI